MKTKLQYQSIIASCPKLSSCMMSWYCFIFFCFYAIISSLTLTVVASPSLSASDIIWKVNENVQPKPLENLSNLPNPPPELDLDLGKGLIGQLFEGCITLAKGEKEMFIPSSIEGGESNPSKKQVISGENRRWHPKNIPYEIKDVGFNGQSEEVLRKHVEKVLESLTSMTCLTFRPKKDDDVNWLQFYDGYGCHSDLGKKSTHNAPTQISIGKGCLADSVVMHLLLHGLGFLHEMNRVDRDSFIDIEWDNIKPEYQELFKRHPYNGVEIVNGQYGYRSIMHFSKFTYSKGEEKATMAAKGQRGMDLGGLSLSPTDITNIKLLFHCSKFDWREWGPWSPCSKPCGVGYHRRKRTCGGEAKDCTGSPSEFSSCRISRCKSLPGDTTFEDNWGFWRPRSKNKCNWKRGRSRLNSRTKGPQEDHTTGTGRFAEVQYGEACQTGVKATMITKRIPPGPGGRCLAFVYDMPSDASLEVQFQDLTAAHPSKIWQMNGRQRQGWVQAAIKIPGLPVSYLVSLVATIGHADSSSVAVDDIYIDDGECPEGLGVCDDFSVKCKEWSLSGECYTNPKWMLLSCCKTCTAISDCVDHDSNCEKRAKTGDCDAHKTEMWSKCCKSCEACLDHDNRCITWAEDGECESNADWMLSNCKRSCNVCRQKL